MIFLQDKNRFLKTADTEEERNKNGKYKSWSKRNGKQKIKLYASDKIENLKAELSENRTE